MRRDQAVLAQRGFAFVATHLRGGPADTETLLEGFPAQGDRTLTESLTASAIATLAVVRGYPGPGRLEVQPCHEHLVPNVEFEWQKMIDALDDRAAGERNLSGLMDMPSVLNGAFSVTLAGLRALATATGEQPVEWAARLALGSARET